MRLLSAAVLALCAALTPVATADTAPVTRCFPDDFLFGSATASYQVEGGWNETGRTPSIWDDFCRANENIQCANVADDFLHRYKEDIDLMVETGLDSFRFSISWSRVMNWDAAATRMKPNAAGIAFYHDLVDTLLAKRILPILTLYHWDLPSELHTQLSPQGWLNRDIVGHFVDYADLMFREFGHKVDLWTTFNEPTSFVVSGYGNGKHAPSLPQSDTNTYTVAHNVLLSHGYAVQRFRQLKENATVQDTARIGIVLVTDYSYPLDPSNDADVEAARRKMDFTLGWFLHPVVYGKYPKIMRTRVGDRLPTYSDEEALVMKGSYDVFMLNHYHSRSVTDCSSAASAAKCEQLSLGWERDHGCDDSHHPAGSRRSSKGPDGEYLCTWSSAYPKGYLDTIRWLHNHDTDAPILLTENGWCGDESLDNADQNWFFAQYIEQVHKAVTEENIPILGYTAWSFMDNYEWGSFKPRFGLYFVNFTAQTGSKEGYVPKPSDLARIPRKAARWYAQLAKTKCMDVVPDADASVLDDAKAKTTARGSLSFSIVAVVLLVAVALIASALAVRRRRAGTVGEQTPLVAN
jgi:beta-glucosidase/6-phospho-beta-glucosidase/beta-galactosidase